MSLTPMPMPRPLDDPYSIWRAYRAAIMTDKPPEPLHAEILMHDPKAEARRARPPFRFAGTLDSFHCFCFRELAPMSDEDDGIIECSCGRRWQRLAPPGAKE